ncbi:MAG: thiazole synthase, partial [Myxococcales bacterium]|nr:thiazole synthase [Myxococcales bacterium]
MTTRPDSKDLLRIGEREFRSRLIIGTGKYASPDLMRAAHEAAGAEVVTVAVRRLNLKDPGANLLDHVDMKRYTLLPNTAGCYTCDDAVRTCRLARELGMGDLVKVEVIGDEKTL